MSAYRDELDDLEARLHALLLHPGATGQDKASLVRAGTCIGEISKRHAWTPARSIEDAAKRKCRSDWRTEWEQAKEEEAHAASPTTYVGDD